jgi:threonine synthase
MNFKKVCLYCGHPVDSLSYSCSCKSDDWTQQYRSIDIDIDIESIRGSIMASFNAYSFDRPAGMLQYHGLPFQHFAPQNIEPVGLTPLHELKQLSKEYNCRTFLKNEGNNPSGCFKDRETMMCFLHSKSNSVKNAVIYSSGNAAASAAAFAENTDQQLITFVSGDTYPEKIDYICNHGSDVVIIGNKETHFETGYRLYSRMNASERFSKSGFDDWSVRNPFRVQGDKTISVEITKQLFSIDENLTPDFVLVPTANGSCLAGIWKGFKELKEAGIINKIPRMISVGIKNANPVSKAVQERQTERPVRCDLSKVAAEDAEVGSIILAEEGYDSIQAAKAVIESNGEAVELHQSDIQKALIDFLKLEGDLAVEHEILPEPAALTSLAAIKKMKKKVDITPSDVLVSISTGHGLKAEKVINALLSGRTDLREKVHKIVLRREHHMREASEKQGQKVQVESNIKAMNQAFLQLQKLPA